MRYFTGYINRPRILSILLLSLLAACSRPEEPLRLGTNIWIGYETLYLAQKLGYYDDLPLKLVEMPSATSVMHAFRNHMLEMAALTLDEALFLKQTDNDIQIILVFDFSHGGDVLLTHPEIDNLPMLKGKKVGVENSAVGAILLDGALTAAKLTPSDINIIPLPVNEHFQAFKNHQVDAIVTFEPVKTQLLLSGANNLFDSRQIPERIVDVLVVRQATAMQHPETLKSLISGYFNALAYIKSFPDIAQQKIAPRMEVPVQALAAQYAGIKIPDKADNIELLSVNPPKLAQTITNLLNLMYRKKLLHQTIDTKNFLNGRFLDQEGSS
jgi:NitT/TauT family transport system substrate-binding protein